MKSRKLISLLCALIMAFSVCCAGAEGEATRTLTYTGGVVLRSIPRGTEDSALLQLAYTLTDMPYIILGESYTWDVFLSGGVQPYNCSAVLAYKPMDQGEFEEGTEWAAIDVVPVENGSFSYTFTGEGRYFWQLEVKDAAGQSLIFQTRIYEAYTSDEESDETTLVGKVNSIIAELITDDMSDYSRARVLHDWIISYANYDYSEDPYRDASGVLLHKTGVCDSYARAYLMLCTAAGLECVYVGGTAGSNADPDLWGPHGWNLVKLGGSWYHVDCTWDDPGEGGYERHDYFCLDDEAMSKDHRWNQPDDLFDTGSMLVPDAEGGELEPGEQVLGDYDFKFGTWAEFSEKALALILSGERRDITVGLYTGNQDVTEMYESMSDGLAGLRSELYSQNLITSSGRGHFGNLFRFYATWVAPTDYLRIDETSLILSVGKTATIVPAEVNEGCGTFTWTSSNPAVATVSAVQNGTDITATITGVSAGTATITATSADGLTDSLTVTSLPAHQPEFNLKLSKDVNGVLVDWDGIPGATAYYVMRRFNGTESQLTAQSEVDVYISEANLPDNVRQEVYIIAKRIAGASEITYISDPVTYGELTISYAAVLPADATEIAAEAFAGSTSLTTLYIPDSVTAIGSRAFADCTGLTAVRLPANLTGIASDAFAGCTILYVEVAEGSAAASWAATHLSGAEILPE